MTAESNKASSVDEVPKCQPLNYRNWKLTEMVHLMLFAITLHFILWPGQSSLADSNQGNHQSPSKHPRERIADSQHS